MKTAHDYHKEHGDDCYDVCSHAEGCIVLNADKEDIKELKKEYKTEILLRCPILLVAG